VSEKELSYVDLRSICFSDWANGCEHLTDEYRSFECRHPKAEKDEDKGYPYCMDCYCPMIDHFEEYIDEDRPDLRIIDLKEQNQDLEAQLQAQAAA